MQHQKGYRPTGSGNIMATPFRRVNNIFLLNFEFAEFFSSDDRYILSLFNRQEVQTRSVGDMREINESGRGGFLHCPSLRKSMV